MLRGDGVAARRGHPVLGAPLGDDAFVQDFVEGRAAEARRLLSRCEQVFGFFSEALAMADSMSPWTPCVVAKTNIRPPY